MDFFGEITDLFQPTQGFLLFVGNAIAFARLLDGFRVNPGRKFAALDVGECGIPLLGESRKTHRNMRRARNFKFFTKTHHATKYTEMYKPFIN